MAGDSYSRMVSILRILLPLIALGILSTLFLVSERAQPGEAIPFADSDVQDRIRDQRISDPIFNGVTSGGDRITVTAKQVTTLAEGGNSAVDLNARLEFMSGGSVTLVSDLGEFDFTTDLADLTGDVVITSATGYNLNSDLITTRLSQIDVTSPGAVYGTGPAGTLNAGSMHIFADENGQNTQMLFTDGVKLIYDPKETKEKQ